MVFLFGRMKAAVDAHACWFDYHQIFEKPGQNCALESNNAAAEVVESFMFFFQCTNFWRHQLCSNKLLYYVAGNQLLMKGIILTFGWLLEAQ